MKKLTPEEIVGKDAEERVLSLVRSLREEQRWIGKPRKAGPKLDQVGIDILVPINVLEQGRAKVIPFAVQVKHSYDGLINFEQKHPEALEVGVAPIVANTKKSDRTLMRELGRLIERRILSPHLDSALEAYIREAKRRRRVHTGKKLKGVPNDS